MTRAPRPDHHPFLGRDVLGDRFAHQPAEPGFLRISADRSSPRSCRTVIAVTACTVAAGAGACRPARPIVRSHRRAPCAAPRRRPPPARHEYGRDAGFDDRQHARIRIRRIDHVALPNERGTSASASAARSSPSTRANRSTARNSSNRRDTSRRSCPSRPSGAAAGAALASGAPRGACRGQMPMREIVQRVAHGRRLLQRVDVAEVS